MANEEEGGFLPDTIDTTGLAPEVVAFVKSAQAALADDDEGDAALAIIERQLTGSTAAEILADGSTTKLADVVGHNVTIHGYRWRRSTVGAGDGAYMLLDVTREGSEGHETVSASAMSVMAQVFALAEHGLLPTTVYVKKADNPTKRGFRPISLLPAEQAF